MATNKLDVKVKDIVRHVDVTDLPDNTGFAGYYYNYRFEIKQRKNKKWHGIAYRPGTTTSSMLFNDNHPNKSLATQILEWIVGNYELNSKPYKNAKECTQ